MTVAILFHLVRVIGLDGAGVKTVFDRFTGIGKSDCGAILFYRAKANRIRLVRLIRPFLNRKVAFAVARCYEFRHADRRAVASTYASSSGPDGLGESDLTGFLALTPTKPRWPAEIERPLGVPYFRRVVIDQKTQYKNQKPVILSTPSLSRRCRKNSDGRAERKV